MFIIFYCTAITSHVCYCDACKCLHGLDICVWFYENKMMMMMMMKVISYFAMTSASHLLSLTFEFFFTALAKTLKYQVILQFTVINS